MVKCRPELHPVPVHSTWHHIGIDFVGPIRPCPDQETDTWPPCLMYWVHITPALANVLPYVDVTILSTCVPLLLI